MKNKSLSFITILTIAVLSTGCSTIGKKWKAFLNGGEEPQQTRVAGGSGGDGEIRFSDKQNLPARVGSRKYKTISREEFEESAKVDDRSGSLWVMEGQSSYLFAQNMVRTAGESLNIVLDGAPKKQLETKASVIKQLIDRLNRPRKPASLAAKPGAGAPGEKPADAKAGAGAAPAAKAESDGGGEDGDKQADNKDGESKSVLGIELIPSRVVERLTDGSYRIKGNQTFMIGKNEYNVIVTGLVRSGDINDSKVEASKIVDPKFDIVGLKKKKDTSL